MIRRLAFAILISAAAAVILFGLCFFGLWIPNEPSRTKYPLRGIDVSHHQGEIDWVRVRSSGIGFAYIKATEGTDFKDPNFAKNWSAAGAAGIKRGAYHFFLLETSGEAQAANFIETVPVEKNTLPPAIDLEFSGYNRDRRPSLADFQRELYIFRDALMGHYKRIPVIYTVNDFGKHYLPHDPIHYLWIREVLTSPPPFWAIWQFSSRGRIKGIRGYVDLNVWNPDEDLLWQHSDD